MAESKSLRRHSRLVRLQRELVNLVDLLDAERMRYPDPNLRGRLHQRGVAPSDRPPWCLSRFIVRDDEGLPWQPFEDWIATQAITGQQSTDSCHRYVCISLGPLQGRLELDMWCDHQTPSGERGIGVNRIEIAGRVRPPSWLSRLRVVPEAVPVDSTDIRLSWSLHKARTSSDSLLRKYERPSVRQLK
jgi:hypothetical protein